MLVRGCPKKDRFTHARPRVHTYRLFPLNWKTPHAQQGNCKRKTTKIIVESSKLNHFSGYIGSGQLLIDQAKIIFNYLGCPTQNVSLISSKLAFIWSFKLHLVFSNSLGLQLHLAFSTLLGLQLHLELHLVFWTSLGHSFSLYALLKPY